VHSPARWGARFCSNRSISALLGSKRSTCLLEGPQRGVDSPIQRPQGLSRKWLRLETGFVTVGALFMPQDHPALYDPLLMKPSGLVIDYLATCWRSSSRRPSSTTMRSTCGHDAVRANPGQPVGPYHSKSTPTCHKRNARYLRADVAYRLSCGHIRSNCPFNDNLSRSREVLASSLRFTHRLTSIIGYSVTTAHKTLATKRSRDSRSVCFPDPLLSAAAVFSGLCPHLARRRFS